MGLKTWQQLVYSAEVLLPVPMIFKINKQLSLFLTSMLQLAQYFFPKLIVKNRYLFTRWCTDIIHMG